ncbi:hypothetical protein AVEN_53256-1 [Araneus ventricosus]|uniref:Uncharacterized protein n=1 Tax=Araneus ventricosus TaxID=182803 RepID=A0A4Y2A9Q3_ARAVE|nr:hypothetical protein AVEN_53256-1 [Araneus ventricosus]
MNGLLYVRSTQCESIGYGHSDPLLRLHLPHLRFHIERLINVKMLPDDYYDQECKCIYNLNKDMDISDKLPQKNRNEMPEVIGRSGNMENLNIKSVPNSDGENSENIVQLMLKL